MERTNEIERSISPRTKLDGGWDKLHFQRENGERRERESKIHMHDNVRSIHPEVGKVGRYLVD